MVRINSWELRVAKIDVDVRIAVVDGLHSNYQGAIIAVYLEGKVSVLALFDIRCDRLILLQCHHSGEGHKLKQ